VRQEEFENMADRISEFLFIVAAAGAIGWIIIPGIWLIIRGV
jgi:hypothetical protein